MDRSPRVIEHGRAPAPRDGSRRPLQPLAQHLLEAIPGAVLVTLHSRRPADNDDDLLVWASIWFRGKATGKVPERSVPAAALLAAGVSVPEMERLQLQALVRDITGALPPLVGDAAPGSAGLPRLRVLDGKGRNSAGRRPGTPDPKAATAAAELELADAALLADDDYDLDEEYDLDDFEDFEDFDDEAAFDEPPPPEPARTRDERKGKREADGGRQVGFLRVLPGGLS